MGGIEVIDTSMIPDAVRRDIAESLMPGFEAYMRRVREDPEFRAKHQARIEAFRRRQAERQAREAGQA